MKVIFIRSWMHFEKGHVSTDIPEGQADILIRRGIVKEVKDQKQSNSKQ